MVSSSLLAQRLLVLLPFSFPTQAPPRQSGIDESNFDWSYDNINRWGVFYPSCDGYRQSPVHLRSDSSFFAPLPALNFENYDLPLQGPLSMVNDGHTVNMDITATTNGQRPTISGGKLLGRFEAMALHFHWGSPSDQGSEHMIDNVRYDVEMHIVHKNVRYADIDEARQYSDGLAVVAIMLNMVNNPDRYYPGLNRIFNKLPQVIDYEATARVNGPLSLSQLLGDVDRTQFFTYKGSLTTPPCSEAVTWQVFPQALPIATSQIFRFFDILDENDQLLLSNYRPLEPLEGRKVVLRSSNFISDFPIFGAFKK